MLMTFNTSRVEGSLLVLKAIWSDESFLNLMRLPTAERELPHALSHKRRGVKSETMIEENLIDQPEEHSPHL
jgi:hypothetical protein